MQKRNVGFLLVVVLGGCTAISIHPECPAELQVGESASVSGNPRDPGAIPTYAWEAVPSDAGTFEAPDQPATMFTAAKEGLVTLRLTASDGLFQVRSQCTLIISPAPPAPPEEPPDDGSDDGDDDDGGGRDPRSPR